MAWLTEEQLASVGFKSYGKGVRISDRAVIYKPEKITIGDRVQIDDFCVISNHITLGNNVQIALYSSLIASDDTHIVMKDFSTLAYRCTVLASSDDYSGEHMTNSTVPMEYKKFIHGDIRIGKHAIIGAGSIVMPGVNIAKGCSIGAMSLVLKSTKPWTIYVGSPARELRPRSKHLLNFEEKYKKDISNDTSL